jgi:spore coat-associated protein N
MNNTEREDRKKRKILVPLVTLTVAAAVAVGSGATFTSTSKVHASVTAGKLIAANDHDKGTLAITKLKPGDKATGTVTLTEDANSDLDGDLSVTVDNVKTGFQPKAVTLTVDGHAYDLDTLAAVAGGSTTISLGSLADGYGTHAVDITLAMAGNADNTNQGKTGSADLTFVLTQTNGSQAVATWTP